MDGRESSGCNAIASALPSLMLDLYYFAAVESESHFMSMSFCSVRFTLAAFLTLTSAPAMFPQVVARPLPMSVPLRDKNFYLLSVLQRNADVHSALDADKDIGEIRAERERSTARAIQSCNGKADCELKTLLWTDEEIHAVSLALMRMYQENAALRKLVDDEIRTSGTYTLYGKQSGSDLLASAWEICARGMNDVLSVYGEGTTPRYPLIDAISFDVSSAEFQQRINDLISHIAATPTQLFFEPSLNAALELLAMNHRDEAARFEPMEKGVNAAVVKAIPGVQWSKYAWTVIVVPGAGPGRADVALSDAGRKRIASAAEAYHAGEAPFILVSGGFVHPAQTRFSEAIEMKKALIQGYNIPESAILVDPHARHTTTNMRNAVREIFRYGIPVDKPALVISDAAQIGYIAGQPFADRCLKELGYLPYRILSRPSDTSLVFQPVIESLEQDPIEPLDP
jgi:hypothetical protein